MKKILIADDNQQIISILKEHSIKEGYQPILAYDGNEAVSKFKNENPDIILLDIMMPTMSGIEVCRDIRKISNVPIIMITARGEDFEKIMGLDVGADDYVVKPFSPGEVMARVRAIFRRIQKPAESESVFESGSLRIKLDDYSAFADTERVDLTRKEFEVLWTLATNAKKVFTRSNLLDSVWGCDYHGESRIVDKYIQRLREKFEKFGCVDWTIKTVRGFGYKFEEMRDEE